MATINKAFWRIDVVLSFAEQSRRKAQGINKALKQLGYKTFYYPDYQHTGLSLEAITEHVYGQKSVTAIVVISDDYWTSRYCQKEWQLLLQGLRTRAVKRLFIIRVGETPIRQVPGDILWLPWTGSGRKIVEQLKPQLLQALGRPGQPKRLVLGLMVLVLGLAAMLYWIFPYLA